MLFIKKNIHTGIILMFVFLVSILYTNVDYVYASTVTWDLSTSNDYTVSNTYTAQISGSQASLKPNIYVKETTIDTRSPYDGVLIDVDNDGDLDIYVATISNDVNSLWINDGTGRYTYTTLPGEINQQTDNVHVADINNDGYQDIYVANLNITPANRFWINNGIGGFTMSNQAADTSNTVDAAFGDLDNDGDLDLVTVNYNAKNKVWINQGGLQGGTIGTFTGSDLSSHVQLSSAVAIGDINGDGYADIYEGNNSFGSAGQNHLWINNQNNTFTGADIVGDQGRTRDVVMGDFDGDSDLDLYAPGDETIQPFWINDGSGNFTVNRGT